MEPQRQSEGYKQDSPESGIGGRERGSREQEKEERERKKKKEHSQSAIKSRVPHKMAPQSGSR